MSLPDENNLDMLWSDVLITYGNTDMTVTPTVSSEFSTKENEEEIQKHGKSFSTSVYGCNEVHSDILP